MDDDRPQFDVLLGGGEELPQDFSMMAFASSRAQEVVAIAEALQEPRRTGLVFQKLPRHMRRRVMSHNAKRMPRQLREAHLRQMEKGGLPPKSKRPSRKYRRRPNNLLESYNRRQRENIWLETHIWHAKRFHMLNKWGYRLPHFPNDKSLRACYRGAANHCLLQDISYYVCIELEGTIENLTSGLQMLTRQECGLSFHAKLWRKGDKEGSIMLFHSDSKYPHGAIGRVHFLWNPLAGPDSNKKSESLFRAKCEEDETTVHNNCKTPYLHSKVGCEEGNYLGEESDQQRKLWLWIHPSYYNEVKEELVKVFKLKQCPPPDLEKRPSEEPPLKRKKTEKSKMSAGKPKKVTSGSAESSPCPKIRSDQVQQFLGSSMKMTLLKDKLIRFRLTGPLSHAVLRDALPLPSVSHPEVNGVPQWYTEWKEVFEHQNLLWEELEGTTSPAVLAPHMVLALTVLDPRSKLPKKRTKAVDLHSLLKSEVMQRCFPPEVSASPIWNSQIRDVATSSKPTDAEVNKRRAENLIPGLVEGSDIESEEEGFFPRLPILLVQRPGSQNPSNRRLGYSSGWDLIAPSGWGKPLWLALIMRGARAIGLREAEVLEDIGKSQSTCWPAPPDTAAGQDEMKLSEKEAKERYFKLPPSKRPNFIRLGISSPFSCPWNILCQEWSSSPLDSASGAPSNDTFYILRETHKLQQISGALLKLRRGGSSSMERGVVFKSSLTNSGEKSHIRLFEQLSQFSDHCFIPVRVTICRKGTVAKYAIICLPQEEDLVKQEYCSRRGEIKGPEEPNNPDPYKEKRDKLRNEHKDKLKSLRRKRLKMCKEADELTTPDDDVGEDGSRIPRKPVMGPKATEELRAQHKRRMEKLFLPAALHARKSCCREVAGYITFGGFSFPEAKEIGLGYITLPAMVSLIQTKHWNQELLALVRNPSSKHYFPAKVDVVIN